jgi:hypothetical protein
MKGVRQMDGNNRIRAQQGRVVKSPQDGAPRDPQTRDRVKGHMRELLIAGSAAGIGLSAALCSVSCDPIPTPSYWSCSDSSSDIWHTGLWPHAVWHLAEEQWTIRVTLNLSGRTLPPQLLFAGNPVVTGASLVTATVDSTQAVFSCIPDSGAALIGVEQPMQCPGKLFSLFYDLMVYASPVEGETVGVQIR